MTDGILAVQRREAGWRLPKADSAVWPLAVLAVLLAGQFWLIFVKSFNWDEFLHYSKVYQLRAGTLTNPFQTLLARLLYWVPDASQDLFDQMLAARMLVWASFLVGLASLYGLASRFVSRASAVWATLAYLAAGTVFTHGFAIRTDPIAMAALMLALCVLANCRIGWGAVFVTGILIGFSGLLTVKSIFYAPCFAGIAWLRLSESEQGRATSIRLAAIPVLAVTSLVGFFLMHRSSLAAALPHQRESAFLSNGMQWLSQGLMPYPIYTIIAMVTAPALVFALIRSPSVWRKIGLGRDARIALIAMCLPLTVILFYRNVFPYFFTFILAPLAVTAAPALGEIRRQYGTAILIAVLCAVPVTRIVSETREVMDNQRAIVDYVHRQFPDGAVTLDYCGMVADYPRAASTLFSGISLVNYHSRGTPLIARAVESGKLAVVIETHTAISLALAGKAGEESLLPADVAALQNNFVRAWGSVWLAGEEIPAGSTAVAIDIPSEGIYTADSAMTVDGVGYQEGDTLELSAGRHIVRGPPAQRAVLWRGARVPEIPAEAGPVRLYTNF